MKILVTVMLFVFTMLVACGDQALDEPIVTEPESEPAEEVTQESDPEPELVSEPVNDEIDDIGIISYGGVDWLVKPRFDYSDIICVDYEGVIARNNGIYIDQKTGKEAGEVFGHGLRMYSLFYDSEKKMFCVFEYGDGPSEMGSYSEKQLASKCAWVYENGKWIEKPYTEIFQIVYSIDTTKIDMNLITEHKYYDEYGYYLEALRGKGAVANGSKFITDFIYDDGEYNGNRYYNNIIAVKKDDKWGIVGKSGEVLTPYIFDEAITIDDDTAFATYEGKVGILYLSPGST